MRKPALQRLGLRRLSSSSSGGGAISLIQGAGVINVAGGSGPTATISHAASAAGGTTTPYPTSVQLDADGHVVAIAAGSAPTVYTGAAPIAVTGSIVSLNDSGIGAGAVAYPSSITFDAKGRATAATAGSGPAAELIANAVAYNLVGAGDVTIGPWAAQKYRRITFSLAYTGQPVWVTGTGLNTNAYAYVDIFGGYPGASSVGTQQDKTGATTNWGGSGNLSGGGSGDGIAVCTVDIPHGGIKGFVWDHCGEFTSGGTLIGRQVRGYNNDKVNDVTALVIHFALASSGILSAWGWF